MIHLSPFSRKHVGYHFCDSWPLCVFGTIQLTEKRNISLISLRKHFRITFSRNFQFLRFSVLEISSPSLKVDFSVTFDHIKLTMFLIDCGKYLNSIFLALCVFPKLSFDHRVPPCFHRCLMAFFLR